MSVNGSGPSERPHRLGEVIEASTVEFVAESYELHESPAFGSLVRVGEGDDRTYGLVYASTTASLDPGRRPVARGRDVEREDEIYRNHPQLARLLRTEFRAVVVGFREGGRIRQQIAPRPVRIHSFVWECPAGEVIEFSQSFDYLSLLIGAPVAAPVDELLAAAVRSADQARGNDEAFRIAAGKCLAVLLTGQFQRLNGILRRL